MTDMYPITETDIKYFVLSVLTAALIAIIAWVILNYEL